MFAIFSRKRTRPARVTLTRETAEPDTPADPEEQVELVCQAVEKLGQIEQLVRKLPELPVGNRNDLLAQLAATSDSLRSLYFLDAIY